MDPRERADAALARARARGTFVVTPDDAISPMDAASTLQIPRSVVTAADQDENTMIIPADQIPQPSYPPPAEPSQRPFPQPASQSMSQLSSQSMSQSTPQPSPQSAPQLSTQSASQEEPPAPRQLDGLVPTV
ncbi:MAG TPA: hypothetical protein VGD84_24410, partial [Pseudonocardiaceae bacterium]